MAPHGVVSATTEVWEMLLASGEGDLERAIQLVSQRAGPPWSPPLVWEQKKEYSGNGSTVAESKVIEGARVNWIVPYIWIAGVVQLLVAISNFFAAKMFRYRESLRTLPAHVAEVFVVQNVFIVFTVVGMAVMCFAFAEELAGSSLLGRSLSGFLSVFWCGRLVFQLFFYDRELRRQHRVFDVLFLLAFAYLVIVFAIGALRANL